MGWGRLKKRRASTRKPKSKNWPSANFGSTISSWPSSGIRSDAENGRHWSRLSKGSRFAKDLRFGRKGSLGGINLAFESIVEEVRRFVARMPPVDSTTGSICFPRNFPAPADQRAGILPVQRRPTLAVGRRCMMRLTRISVFPFFSLSITDWFPLHPRCLPQCPEKFLGSWGGYTCLTGQSTYCSPQLPSRSPNFGQHCILMAPGKGKVAWIQEECRDAHRFSNPRIRQSSRCCEGRSRRRVEAGPTDGRIPSGAFCGGSK